MRREPRTCCGFPALPVDSVIGGLLLPPKRVTPEKKVEPHPDLTVDTLKVCSAVTNPDQGTDQGREVAASEVAAGKESRIRNLTACCPIRWRGLLVLLHSASILR
jgi:hypothetical protein